MLSCVVAHIVIIFHIDRVKNLHHHHTSSKQCTLVRDESMIMYANIYVVRI